MKKSKGLYKWVNKDEAYLYFCSKPNGRDYPTLEEVARHFNCHPVTIQKMSMREKWVDRRETATKTAVAKFQAEMRDIAEAEQYKEFEDWNRVEDIVNTAMEMIRQSQQKVLQASTIEEKTLAIKLLRKLSYDMLNLATVLKMAKHGKRTLLGIATEITKGEITHRGRLENAPMDELVRMAQFALNNYKDDTTTPTAPPTNS